MFVIALCLVMLAAQVLAYVISQTLRRWVFIGTMDAHLLLLPSSASNTVCITPCTWADFGQYKVVS